MSTATNYPIKTAHDAVSDAVTYAGHLIRELDCAEIEIED